MKEKEELNKLLEESYARGIKLVDNLVKTANLHKKMLDNLHSLISRLIAEGKYEKAEFRLNNAISLIEEIEVRNIASHIQDKMMDVMEGK